MGSWSRAVQRLQKVAELKKKHFTKAKSQSETIVKASFIMAAERGWLMIYQGRILLKA